MYKTQNSITGIDTPQTSKKSPKWKSGTFSALVAASVFVLSGCDSSPKENLVYAQRSWEVKYEVVPEWLKDCKFYEVKSLNKANLIIVRCPNSSTSTNHREWKVDKNMIVIDGDEVSRKVPE